MSQLYGTGKKNDNRKTLLTGMIGMYLDNSNEPLEQQQCSRAMYMYEHYLKASQWIIIIQQNFEKCKCSKGIDIAEDASGQTFSAL